MRFGQSILGALIIVMLLSTQPSYAQTTVIVTNCSNDTQLRQAANAPGTSQISFSCGAGPHTIPVTGSKIEVQGNVTINGGGTIVLDGNNATGIFQVFSAAALELRNLTVQRGSTNIPALENFGVLSLDKVLLLNNQGSGDGGAIASYKTLIVHNSSFLNNTTSSSSISTRAGGAILGVSGTIAVANSSFNGNQVLGTTGTGGAIALNNANLQLSDSSFSANKALDGGAIWVGSSSTAAITNTMFLNNQAGYGAAIESSGQTDIDHSTFANNSATSGDGGAIWVFSHDVDIAFSTFSSNQAKTTGGAISCYANTVSVINSTLNGNSAGSHGGGIYSSCNLNMTNSTLSANTAVQGGGGVYQTGSGSAAIAAVTMVANKALFGAGVYNDGSATSSMTLSATMLNDNTPDDCGGVITSNGDNLSGDTTCGAFTQTGDKKDQTLPLSALMDNGGPTYTHMPLTGNPAINALPPARCGFSSDQRGAARPAGTNCDIGAVEAGAMLPRLYLPLVIR